MSNKIFAIDPGNEESGYVIVEHDRNEITRVLQCGKVPNGMIFDLLTFWSGKTEFDLAIEMIASYGMPVGKEVFDTCLYIGRFWEHAVHLEIGEPQLIYRKDEKLAICGDSRAKDQNVRRALIDRYAPGQKNDGKGTKKSPGFFYGFRADIWQAFAVAVTYFDVYVKGVTKL